MFNYQNIESLTAHVLAFVTAYNLGKHLKVLRWRPPFQAISDAWTKDPTILKVNSDCLILKPPLDGTVIIQRTTAASPQPSPKALKCWFVF